MLRRPPPLVAPSTEPLPEPLPVGATGVSRPSRTSRLSSWVWCTTSSSTPNWPYSFFSVLKQCAQVATTFFALVSVSPSAFCIASCWNTNSLPDRRAGSPLQVSPLPRTAKETPAMSSSSATARVVFLARSSYAPAQPTQNSQSTSSSDSTSSPTTRTGKSSPLAQSIRAFGDMFQGLPLFSRPLNSWFSSVGKFDSTRTW